MNLEMFPPAIQELNKEITYHPRLQEILNFPENANLGAEERLAVIAGYCQLLMMGDYTSSDLYKIADVCVMKLKQMRTELIILPPGVQ